MILSILIGLSRYGIKKIPLAIKNLQVGLSAISNTGVHLYILCIIRSSLPIRITCRCDLSPPTYTPLLYSKTWVYRGILFSYFCSKIDCGYSLEPH